MKDRSPHWSVHRAPHVGLHIPLRVRRELRRRAQAKRCSATGPVHDLRPADAVRLCDWVRRDLDHRSEALPAPATPPRDLGLHNTSSSPTIPAHGQGGRTKTQKNETGAFARIYTSPTNTGSRSPPGSISTTCSSLWRTCTALPRAPRRRWARAASNRSSMGGIVLFDEFPGTSNLRAVVS